VTAVPEAAPRVRVWPGRARLPVVLAALAFIGLFAQPAALLARDWWNDSEAGHGLLLAPLALWLAWRDRPRDPAEPNPVFGTAVLVAAILLRYVAGLAAELFTLRFSIVLALAGLTIFWLGERQVRRWWLPFALLTLSIPLPALVTNALTLPLQFKASAIGAALLDWRHVPVRLSGNVIQLPGRQLFVTEACSGIRSLVALISLGVLVGGLWLRTPIGRLAVLALAVPVAVAVNAVRVFLTGFLVYFLNPALGEGFMHLTEGWLLFLIAFSVLAAGAWGVGMLERLALRARHAE